MGFLNSEFSDTVLWNTAAISCTKFLYFSLFPIFTTTALQLISNRRVLLAAFYKAQVFHKQDKRSVHIFDLVRKPEKLHQIRSVRQRNRQWELRVYIIDSIRTFVWWLQRHKPILNNTHLIIKIKICKKIQPLMSQSSCNNALISLADYILAMVGSQKRQHRKNELGLMRRDDFKLIQYGQVCIQCKVDIKNTTRYFHSFAVL